MYNPPFFRVSFDPDKGYFYLTAHTTPSASGHGGALFGVVISTPIIRVMLRDWIGRIETRKSFSQTIPAYDNLLRQDDNIE